MYNIIHNNNNSNIVHRVSGWVVMGWLIRRRRWTTHAISRSITIHYNIVITTVSDVRGCSARYTEWAKARKPNSIRDGRE